MASTGSGGLQAKKRITIPPGVKSARMKLLSS
jgi:hypothetical protein